MDNQAIQVQLDADLLAALDSRARSEGRSRAEVIRAACRSYLENQETGPVLAHRRGALALMGAWSDVSDEEIDTFIADVYAERANDVGRPVDLEQ